MQLATVRWVKSERTGTTDMGLQLMDGRPNAVNCRPADDESGALVHCLFLPSKSDSNSSAGLIAAKELYQPGRRLLLYVGRREVSVKAARRVLETVTIDRFEFSTDAGM